MKTFKRLFFVTFLLFSLSFAAAAWGQDFGVNIDRIYYQDNSGREIDYNFSTGEMDQYGVVTIPPSAVTAPASESSTTFSWGPVYEIPEVGNLRDVRAESA